LVELISHITKQSWTIERRYSEFFAIHEILRKIYPRLPEIPGKTITKVTTQQAINKRKELLQLFLRECVQRRDILQNIDFQKFLELEKYAPEIIGNNVQLIYDYQKCPLGVRNFIVVPHREIMLVCCSNMSLISRTNVSFANFAFGKQKDEECQIPMGAAFIYQCKPDKNEIYTIHKIWGKAFSTQTGVIHWEDKNQVYTIGLDDGRIIAYKGDKKTYYLKMDKVCELCFHTQRIMGVGLDPYTLKLYSCSTDKCFYVTDLTKSSIQNVLINTSITGYTNMELDADNKRIFLTNESGELSVYSLRTNPPLLVRNLQTSSLSSIRAFHIDYINNYIFTGNVGGKICIMNLTAPNKERLISEISNFGVGEQKIRVCRNDPINYELITGDENGRVTIWNLKTGKPIYLWEAHPKSAITQMWYQHEEHILWTGGKDLRIRMWKLPEKWVSEEVKNFDKNEVNNITAKLAEEKLVKIQYEKQEGLLDSDDDDLNGWCFRKF
jgi:WD40 repeat protein